MDNVKVGKAIRDLRKRAGYTQRDLAARMGISDKAVSKWERGISMPDITSLRRLAILLGTNVDNLLEGKSANNVENWHGVIILNNNPLGIGTETIIYDKPLISYLISYCMLVGIKEITISCSEKEKDYICSEMGNGSDYGIQITCETNFRDLFCCSLPKNTENIMMIYGRFFLYGVDQTRFFLKAMQNNDHFTSLAIPKIISDTEHTSRTGLSERIIIIDRDKSARTQYEYYQLPIAFFRSEMLPEIADFCYSRDMLDRFFSEREIYIELLDRGVVEIELNDWDDIREVSEFVRIVQDRCGMKIYCLEEIAWRRGLISLEKMKELGERRSGDYGSYILSLYNKTM